MMLRILLPLITVCALVADAKDDVLVVEPGKSIAKCLSGDVREMVLKDGYYSVSDLIEIGSKHDGLVIRAEHPRRAVVVAGEVFPARMFTKTGDVLRLRVSDKVHSVLVKAVRPVLSVDGVAMTHARWPNEGYWTVPKIPARGMKMIPSPSPRAAKWLPDDIGEEEGLDIVEASPIEAFGMTGAYVSGGVLVNSVDRQMKTLDLSGGVQQGMRFFFHGSPEEIDRPGEWAYDGSRHEIVLMPPASFTQSSQVAIGLYDKGLFKISGSGISLQGICFTAIPAGTGAAIVIDEKARNCTVEGCRFTAFGGEAIWLNGRENKVQSCDFEDIYGCCVRVNGGNKKLLAPGGNVVDNCLFTRPCAMRDGCALGAVRLDGVRNRVSHCVIHNVREHAMDWNGYECVVEYCRMYDANLEFRDSGVVYSQGSGSYSYGCHFRFNDISGAPGLSHGIYPDDCSSGHLIYGNVVRNVGWGGIFLGGGRNNLISNNVIAATGAMALHNDNRGLWWPAWADHEKWHERAVELYDYVDGPVGKRWPEFARWRDDGTNMFGNVDNVWVNNVVIDSPNTQDQACNDMLIPLERQICRGNVSFGLRKEPCTDVWRFGGFKFVDLRETPDRLFVNVPPLRMMKRSDGLELYKYERGDFNLADGSVIRTEIPDFVPIPWDKIGLYMDKWRKVLPSENALDYVR